MKSTSQMLKLIKALSNGSTLNFFKTITKLFHISLRKRYVDFVNLAKDVRKSFEVFCLTPSHRLKRRFIKGKR